MFFLGFAMRDDDEPFLCQQTLRSRLEKWIRIRTDIQQAEKGTRKQQQKRKLFYKVLKKSPASRAARGLASSTRQTGRPDVLLASDPFSLLMYMYIIHRIVVFFFFFGYVISWFSSSFISLSNKLPTKTKETRREAAIHQFISSFC